MVIVEMVKRRLNAFQDVDNSHYGVARLSILWQLWVCNGAADRATLASHRPVALQSPSSKSQTGALGKAELRLFVTAGVSG